MRILRYWGSHFKTFRQLGVVVAEFRPMLRRGWECHLVIEREPERADWLNELKGIGVRIHVVARPRMKFDPAAIIRIVRLCLELKPDVILCENIHDSPLVGAVIAGVPVRIWIKRAMNAAFERNERQGLRNRFAPTTRLSCGLATRIVAVSRAARDELIGLGVAGRKVLVRPNPRRLGPMVAGEVRAEIRGSLGFSDTDVIWVTVGHAVPVKGWGMLIRAFRSVAIADPRARLLLVGGLDRPEERPTAEFLRAEIGSLGLRDKVRLVGHVEDVAACLRAGDAFVLPSHSEGFCNALIEALESGLPCVSTRVGIAPDVIRDGFNGRLVDRFDEVVLTEAMIAISCDDTLRAELAANAMVPDMIPDLDDYAEGLAGDIEHMWDEVNPSLEHHRAFCAFK